MRMNEILELNPVELNGRLQDLMEEHQNFRFQHATRQLDNPLRLRHVRRDIARIKTVLNDYQTGRRTPKATTTA